MILQIYSRVKMLKHVSLKVLIDSILIIMTRYLCETSIQRQGVYSSVFYY